MKYALDFEFDDGVLEWISLGLKAEDGREYYAQNTAFEWGYQRSDWLDEHVRKHLDRCRSGFSARAHLDRATRSTGAYPQARCAVDGCPWCTQEEVVEELLVFIGQDATPEFWGYYSDYDWVLFCRLFGTMSDLPKNFPLYCRDLRQELDRVAIAPFISQPDDGRHHALDDARWIMETLLRVARTEDYAPIGYRSPGPNWD